MPLSNTYNLAKRMHVDKLIKSECYFKKILTQIVLLLSFEKGRERRTWRELNEWVFFVDFPTFYVRSEGSLFCRYYSILFCCAHDFNFSPSDHYSIPYNETFLTCILQCRDYTRAQNVWSGWPAYEVKCLCSIGRDWKR